MTKSRLVDNPKVQGFLLWLLRIVMKLLLRFEITNRQNMPLSGPVVVIINHITWLDPILALGGAPRVVIPMAKQEIFDWFFVGSIMKLYGSIPVQRDGVDVTAFKSALRVLKNNGAVLLAPEGTRSRNRQLQAGKDGAVMLALRSNAAIVPVGVTGTHLVETNWKKLKRAAVHLAVGEPFRLRSLSANRRTQRSDIEAMTHEMMYRLARQLPGECRGVYANPETVTESYLVPVEN